jgi:ParB family chromosome partitioning protein
MITLHSTPPCPSAKAAIIVFGKNVGHRVTVCLDDECPVHTNHPPRDDEQRMAEYEAEQQRRGEDRRAEYERQQKGYKAEQDQHLS